ncbi:membrane magnesium transporter 1-like [Anneissia japonica]|uniref:membrane magnesium transporter 1-like n=1 Tax=Anneissia japonica TaxID=1529436 RepID=UPI001425B6BC|nr:membrane magnesium transporter 1-like [Anneissia japonica]
MASFYHFLVFIGIISLTHSAYSAAQHRTYLRLTEQEFTNLPADIILQSLISLVITAYGILHIAGKYKNIRVADDMEKKSFETVGNCPSFYIFKHRGKVLFGNGPYSKNADS